VSGATLNLKSAFDTDDPREVVTRLESLKDSLNKAPNSRSGNFSPALPGYISPPPTAAEQIGHALDTLNGLNGLNLPDIGKGTSLGDTISSLTAQLATQQADLVKDLTLTSPLSTGYVAYDLEAPAKLLTPRPTPLRNRLPRTKGIGTARRFKRITGYTGTGTGGVGLQRPGITDTTQTAFQGINYVRGPKISYAGDESAVPYLQFSLSDAVPWSAQFSGQGFQDIRQLSQTSLMYASMLMEERLLLGGRGTASGFAGALSTPGTPTLTVRAARAGETGNTANIATLYVFVTAATIFGETLAGTANTTGMSASTGNVVDVSLATPVSGALGYKIYAGTVNGAGTVFPANLTISGGTGNAIQSTVFGNQVSSLGVTSGATAGTASINFTGGGTGGAPSTGQNPPGAGSSYSTTATDSSALDYDGLLTIANGANSGYTAALDASFGSNPGNEYNTAFSYMWDNVKADPDVILMAGADRKQLSDLIKTNSNTSAYRISLTREEAHDATIGSVVNGLQNEVTGKLVDITVHPWMPQGISPILSWELPIPDTEVSSCFEVVNVQDYMAVQWPVTQFAYESSTYWYGTFLCYAPAWQGCISRIIKK
jgi:hypothetical protein